MKDLVLRDNLISNIKCLRKGNFPKLRDFCLRGNSIVEVDKIGEGEIHLLDNLNLSMVLKWYRSKFGIKLSGTV